MNYQQLVDAITSNTENYEQGFIENIPTFVQQAEQQIFNSVQLLELRRNITSYLTVGHPYIKLPTDFLAVYSLAVVDNDGAYSYMVNKDVNFIREAFPNPRHRGIPTHYALFEDRVALIGPAPDERYKVELHQFYYPESIVTRGTSWVGDNFESVLLYGALVHANAYMKGDEDMGNTYAARFQESLALLKRMGDGMNRQDVYRSGQVKLPVT